MKQHENMYWLKDGEALKNKGWYKKYEKDDIKDTVVRGKVSENIQAHLFYPEREAIFFPLNKS